MKTTVEDLRKNTKGNILKFIRETLNFEESIKGQLRHVKVEDFEKEHYRFDMSGFENKTGENTLHNQLVLNKFAYLGIYDYTHYLFLDFYKGTPTIYLKYFNENENLEYKLEGAGTVEIIYEIFKLTILSNKEKRQRI